MNPDLLNTNANHEPGKDEQLKSNPALLHPPDAPVRAAA